MKRIVETEEEESAFLSAVAAAESFAKRRKPNQDETEGAYTAALKGSKSRIWQHINPLNTWQSKSRVAASAAAGSDSEKTCPCGSGPCLILTANTERNRGRMFYKCPLRQVHSPLLYYFKNLFLTAYAFKFKQWLLVFGVGKWRLWFFLVV